MKKLALILLSNLGLVIFAQDEASLLDNPSAKTSEKVYATFKTTRLINLTTNEQVKKGELDFRIAHRFGDLAGSRGGEKTLFGLDNVADIRFSFDYGITDRIAVGIGRSKGAYQQLQIYDLNAKFKILEQESVGIPIGLSFYGGMTYTSQAGNGIAGSLGAYEKMSHRVGLWGQLLAVRKMNKDLSIIVAPTVLQRNYVILGDNNTNFALGLGIRYKISKRSAIIADYYQLLNKSSVQNAAGYVPPIGLGYELETGGHVFHVVLSNTRGLTEPQFITQGTDDPTLGQIRLGFNISRVFTILRDKSE